MAKEWFPHEYVPWSEGRNYDGPLGGEAWSRRGLADVRRGPHRADRQPAHRGQPAQLPPRDRDAVRPRRRVGRLGAPLDRRGGPARHRDPRLPAVTRAVDPVAAGAARMDAHVQRLHQRPPRRHARTRWPTSRSRSWPPGSRTATPARSPATRSPTSCWPGSRPTRTCTWSSTATCSAPRSSSAPNQTMRAITDVVTDVPDARRRHRRASSARPWRWPSPASTTSASTATTWSRRCCATGTSSSIEGLDAEGEQARTELADFLDELEKQAAPVRGEARRPSRPPRPPLNPRPPPPPAPPHRVDQSFRSPWARFLTGIY